MLAALLLLPAQATAIATDGTTIHGAAVAKVYPAPLGCGMFMTWGAVDLIHGGGSTRIYLLCAMAANLPKAGARCTIRFHVGTVKEFTGDARQTPFEGAIADTMTCDPPVRAPLT
jgi:hypothetical protein